jgi:hypothetical protein
MGGIRGFIDFLWSSIKAVGSALITAITAPLHAITASFDVAIDSLSGLGPLAPLAIAAIAAAVIFIVAFIAKRLLNLL